MVDHISGLKIIGVVSGRQNLSDLFNIYILEKSLDLNNPSENSEIITNRFAKSIAHGTDNPVNTVPLTPEAAKDIADREANKMGSKMELVKEWLDNNEKSETPSTIVEGEVEWRKDVKPEPISFLVQEYQPGPQNALNDSVSPQLHGISGVSDKNHLTIFNTHYNPNSYHINQSLPSGGVQSNGSKGYYRHLDRSTGQVSALTPSRGALGSEISLLSYVFDVTDGQMGTSNEAHQNNGVYQHFDDSPLEEVRPLTMSGILGRGKNEKTKEMLTFVYTALDIHTRQPDRKTSPTLFEIGAAKLAPLLETFQSLGHNWLGDILKKLSVEPQCETWLLRFELEADKNEN